jgi:thymidylate kinase
VATNLGGKVSTRGRLICFEGLDGAGKTTLAKKLAHALKNSGESAIFIERKNSIFPTHELTARMVILRELIWEYGDLPLQDYGDEHALYNMASWFSVLDRCKIQPLLASGTTVVIDNWYYKFAARFKAKPHMDFQHVLRTFDHLCCPDLVIFLDVTPTVAVQRKQSFSKGECGNFDGLVGTTAENFLRYQQMVHAGLLELSQGGEWLRVAVDHRTLDEIEAEITAKAVQRHQAL